MLAGRIAWYWSGRRSRVSGSLAAALERVLVSQATPGSAFYKKNSN